MVINYGKQTIDSSDIKQVIKVLKSDFLTQGPKVEKFEKSLNKYFKSKYSSVVSNGTAALHLIGKALKWKEGDIIFVTPITFLATANCILYSNATPVFIDIDQYSYTIDPQKIEEKILFFKKKNKKARAIIATDFAGNCCDWHSLRYLSDKYNLELINDNCHALGSKYNNNKGYAVKYADAVIHSYHPVKNITTGEGGAILTNNFEIDKKIKILRSHGYTKKVNNNPKKNKPWFYQMDYLGYNYRLTDFQCALGINQLNKLDNFVTKKRKIANFYNNQFKEKDYFITPYVKKNIYHAYHLYPLQIDFKKIKKNKIDLFHFMQKYQINLQVHYIPIHYQPYYKKKFKLKKGSYPLSEKFYFNEVSLPIFPNLKIKDLYKIVNTIHRFIKK